MSSFNAADEALESLVIQTTAKAEYNEDQYNDSNIDFNTEDITTIEEMISLPKSNSDTNIIRHVSRLEYELKTLKQNSKNDKSKEPPTDPSIPLTMIYTDVQGSTSLWEALPQDMEKALEMHDQCMRTLIAKHDGFEGKCDDVC